MPAVAPGAVVRADRVLSHGPAPRPDPGQCEIRGDPVLVPALPARPARLLLDVSDATGSVGDDQALVLDLRADEPVVLQDLTLRLDPAAMLQVEEQRPEAVRCRLEIDGAIVAQRVAHVQLLAAHQWLSTPPVLAMEMLSAHVMPNHPAIGTLMREVSTRLQNDTGRSSLEGYQSGPERVDQIARAIYETVRDRRIAYVEPPASWVDDGQKVRTPGEVLDGRAGTCLDTVVVMAAALEQAGIRPLIWLPQGHAFLGYWREESSLGVSVECDPAGVVNQVDLGRMAVVDTTAMTHRDLPFEDASRLPAIEHLAGDLTELLGVVDVHQARVDRIIPLPARVRTTDGIVQIFPYTPAAPVAVPHTDPPRAAPGSPRPNQVPARITQWKNGLLDLSLRNRLINFTERSKLGVVLPDGSLGHLEDLLHQGSSISLRAGDEFAAVERERGLRSARNLPQLQLTELLRNQRTVHVEVTTDAYPTRLRNLAHKARTIVEESGANNLYLALGTLEWQFDARTLRSPLILVPVVLSAGRRGGRYQVALDESGMSTPNYCLIEKLRQTHGLEIPALADPVLDEAGIDLDAVFDATRRVIADRGLPFRVEATADLAILQFAKFRLWKDLDENWAELARNPLVAHLVHTPTDAFADAVADPGTRDLEGLAEQCPVSADASQLKAVHDAVLGRSFVLEGPPGTGKSQTITNLLAHSVAEGKRVLFVAEKRAALDVVQKRLDAVGMGPLSLDLHDKGSKPAAVRHQILAALDHAVPVDAQAHEIRVEELRSARRGLTRYWNRLGQPNAAGFSLPSARDAELVHRDVEAMPVPEPVVTGDRTTVARLRTVFTALPEYVDDAAPRAGHPWAFVDQAAGVDVSGAAVAARRIDSLFAALPVSLTPALDAAALPEDLRILGSLVATGVPVPVLDAVRTERWASEVRSLRADITSFVSTPHPGLETVTPEVLSLPIRTIAEAADTAAASSLWGRRKRLLAAAEELSPVLRADAKVKPKRLVELTRALVQVRDGVDALVDRLNVIPGLSARSGWTPYDEQEVQRFGERVAHLQWASRMVDEAGTDPERRRFSTPLRAALRAGPADPQAVLEMASATAALAEACGIGPRALADWARPTGLLVRLQQTAPERRAGDPELRSLRVWTDLLRHVEPLRHDGLGEVRERILRGEVDADQARLSFELGTARAAVTERLRSTGLDHFDPPAHDRSIQRFRHAADEVRGHLTTVLPGRVLTGRGFDPSSAGGRVGQLRRQLTMKRRGMKVRELMSTFGDLITDLTPCVLVSPDSLARFFPATSGLFDIVVFDEASQVRVADAVGAMGRARSIVVVGDSKQMPPTSVAESGAGDEFELDGAADTVEDEESILTECVQARVARHRLSWHYRSRDEALIAFSNQMYYDGGLSTFPSPTSDDDGISLVRVDGHFHRSGKGALLRTNPEEAQAVVDEIRRRFTASPDRPPSLGVVTFNQQQRAHIEGLLRDTDDPRLIEALEDPDGLFVKNLENVQGDERDVVLFSTAFSVNDKGVLPLNFGPLNRAGGERRLNVAVTRARRRVIVYSSFDPAQMRTEETSSVGVRHLRTYLEVAARGTSVLPQDRRAATVRDRHRDDIAAVLRARGIDVTTGVGLSDFTLDLVLSADGAAHVAVLLDGPGWATRMTAGDRDVLPHQVLGTALAWPSVERVWLPEWLSDRDSVADRLATALATSATRESDPIPDAAEVEQPTPSAPAAMPQITKASAQPAEPAILTSNVSAETGRRQIGQEPFQPWVLRTAGPRDVLDALPARSAAAQVSDVLVEVVEAEGPITFERLARLVARAFDLTRVAESRSSAIMRHLPRSVRRDDAEKVAWPSHRDPQAWVGFRPSTAEERRLEEIPLREIGNAMRSAVAAAAGMDREELYAESLRTFGFVRRTPSVVARLDRAVELALRNGRVVMDAGLLLRQFAE
ncbi:MAG: DUF3320 domain-containing protein [Pseudonocardia sp.]|nr:DUF3320 domain-containing protein [Pseudonocardia sp.]